jgi:ERF superfamily
LTAKRNEHRFTFTEEKRRKQMEDKGTQNNETGAFAAFAASLALAQGEIEAASKSAANPHFKSKYANLSEIIGVVRPALNKHGLALLQDVSIGDGVVSVTNILTHSGGAVFRSSPCRIPVDKPTAHGYGSAITYARRYSLASFLCVEQEDDDGNAASGMPAKAEATPSARFPSKDSGR